MHFPIRMRKKCGYSIVGYYVGLPSRRDGFESRYPLHDPYPKKWARTELFTLSNVDLVKRKEGEPIIISVAQAKEATDNLSHAIRLVVEPIRCRIQSLLTERKKVAVAVAGGCAVGKSDFFTPALVEGLSSTLVFSEDDYCVGNSVSRERFGVPNLYVPEDFDPDLLREHVVALKRGEDIEKPVYSYEIRERIDTTRVSARQVLVVEGEFLLHPPLSDEFDLKVFIDSDDHSRFVRRMIRPRRNPSQTDVERVMEYFQLSFPHYHSHIAPTMENADFVVENAYHPEEGHARMKECESELLMEGNDAERIFMSLYPGAERRVFARQYYTHRRKKPSEVLYSSSDDISGHHFRYSSGSKARSQDGVVSPWVRFDLEETSIDLTEVGYTPILHVEGKEWSLSDQDSTVHLIQLNDGRKVVQVVSNNISAGRHIIDRLSDAGLIKSVQTLDQWLQN